jgi:hypothetical protein
VGVIQAHKVRVQYKKPTSADFASFADGWGVVKSLALIGVGPVGVIRTQKFQFFLKQNTHFDLSFSAFDPTAKSSHRYPSVFGYLI